MLMTSLLHFLNMNYLLLFLKCFSCIGRTIAWRDSIFLKLYPSEFDHIYLGKSSRLIKSLPSINISSNLSLFSSSTIHSLGFIFDSSFSLIPRKEFVAKSVFFHLRRIKQLKLFLDNPTLKLLVSLLIFSL